MKRILIVAAATLAIGGLAMAQMAPHAGHAGMPGMSMMQAPADATPATRAYIAVMNRMHDGMMMTYSGNADRDFAAGMIPHHQGAIDMAKIVLAHGKDPAIRKLAEDVIAAQDSEIAMMRKWLAAKGK